MKNKIVIKFRKTFVLGLILALALGCERDLTDDAVEAKFSSVAEIFTDDFIGMGTDFYLPFAGAKQDAFSVDRNVGYESSASFRIDVPNADDATGNYAGAILRVDGAPRDLSGYNALTFWAKASQGTRIGEIGFGLDFIQDKYKTAATNLSIGTNWAKYIVPIPDPSKLTNERGVLWYSAGTQTTGGSGYILWLDDIKFENLGTLGQPRAQIAGGEDLAVDTFTGVTGTVGVGTYSVNSANGDVTVTAAPSYFEYTSSNPNVITVDALGNTEVQGAGTAIITATIGGIEADGSLVINSVGDFDLAPTPSRDASEVLSIFSDAYNSVNVDFFNGYWEPFQTTLSADFEINGDNILNYTNFNFVGNQFANPTLDISTKSNLHINMYIPGEVPANFDFLISVVDFGLDKADGGGDDNRQQIFVKRSDVVANTWMTLEFPITMPTKSSIGLIIYENINGSSLSNFYLDNIYFYSN